MKLLKKENLCFIPIALVIIWAIWMIFFPNWEASIPKCNEEIECQRLICEERGMVSKKTPHKEDSKEICLSSGEPICYLSENSTEYVKVRLDDYKKYCEEQFGFVFHYECNGWRCYKK